MRLKTTEAECEMHIRTSDYQCDHDIGHDALEAHRLRRELPGLPRYSAFRAGSGVGFYRDDKNGTMVMLEDVDRILDGA